MEFPALWIIVSFLASARKSASDPRSIEAALICSNMSAANSDRQVFVANFLAAMDSVTPQIAKQKYGVVVNGTGNNTVYTFGECLKDLAQNDCDLCFARCKTQILRCLPFQRLVKGGRLFYDGCYLRYDDYRFFNESLSSVDRTVCGGGDFVGNQTLFGENVMELARNMRVEGPKSDGFFTGFVNKRNLTVYGLAQCWEFVKRGDCVKCMENSVSRIGSCPPKAEGRVLNAGCYLRYSLTRFYNNSGTDSFGGGGGSSNCHTTILASVFAAIAFLLFIAVIALFGMMKILRLRREKKKLGSVLAIVNKSKINFSFEHLEKATNYFHISNKLGHGGSGAVYKGTLSGGKIVAVKRLFFNTSQWADHFFNEVNLISGIDHTNLVKLLGCSITGPESLLVYEYVPNQSLHYHLFGCSLSLKSRFFTPLFIVYRDPTLKFWIGSGRKHGQPLSWEDRYKIILGTASGLAFLHEGSQLRIIHRDIKLSNVLLDDDFNPKIADFGLARLFPEDQSHISTAIAGTFGYMAPEYIVRGQLTEKVDVYSFGVLVIEVICGAKNTDSFPILQKVWNLFGLGKVSEAVDPLIKGVFPEEEASRLLHIGLLCVQADAEIRPSMSTIVKTLTHVYEIPQPTQPPFLSSTSSGIVGQFKYQPGTRFSQPGSYTHSSGNEITESFVEPR